MTRRDLMWCCACAAACAAPKRALEQTLPQQVGTWRRGDVSKLSSIPETVSRFGVEDAAETTYSDEGNITVQVFQMRAGTAFELMQKWRQSDGLAYYKGDYFFIARSAGADNSAVVALLRELVERA